MAFCTVESAARGLRLWECAVVKVAKKVRQSRRRAQRVFCRCGLPHCMVGAFIKGWEVCGEVLLRDHAVEWKLVVSGRKVSSIILQVVTCVVSVNASERAGGKVEVE